MSFDKKEYQRELMRKRRASEKKEAVANDATYETREDLKNLSGGVESRHAKYQDVTKTQLRSTPENEWEQTSDEALPKGNVTEERLKITASGSSAPPAQNNLPVPVLADAKPLTDFDGHQEDGEARESNGTPVKVKANVTDFRGRQKLPKGIPEKEWAHACERAERAKKYATNMPGFVGPGDKLSQDPMWQWENQVRGRFGGIVGGSLSGSRSTTQ